MSDRFQLPPHCYAVRPFNMDHRSDYPTHTYGRWDVRKDGRWFVPEWLTGSDYSGTLVERANLRAFKEAFPQGEGSWWVEVHGGHGTFGVLVRTLAYKNATEVREFFDALEDYPLASDDLHSELECEAEQAAWEDYGRKDFVAEVKAYAEHVMSQDGTYDDAIEAAAESIDDDQWDATWRDVCDRSNVNGGTGYVNEQGDAIHFYTEEAVWGRNARYPWRERRHVGTHGFWNFILEDGRDFRTIVLEKAAELAKENAS